MIAVVPLIIFLSGFVTSMAIPIISKKLEHNLTYVIGGVFLIGGFIWAYYLADPLPIASGVSPDAKYEIIGVAIVSTFSITFRLYY